MLECRPNKMNLPLLTMKVGPIEFKYPKRLKKPGRSPTCSLILLINYIIKPSLTHLSQYRGELANHVSATLGALQHGRRYRSPIHSHLRTPAHGFFPDNGNDSEFDVTKVTMHTRRHYRLKNIGALNVIPDMSGSLRVFVAGPLI